MKRVAPWVLVLAGLAWAGCFPATVGVTVPVGPAYEEPPPPAQPVMEAQVYVSNQPPPPQVEYPPPAPGPGYAWISGYWDWTGYNWNWVGGYWTPSRPGYFYVAPRYVVIGGRPVYERGYWHDHEGRRDYQYARPAPMYHGSPPPGHPGMYGGPPPGPGHVSAGAAGALPPVHSQPGPNPGWRGNPGAAGGTAAALAPVHPQAGPNPGSRGNSGAAAGTAAALAPVHSQGSPTPAASPTGQAGMLHSHGPTAAPAPGPSQTHSSPAAGAATRLAAPRPAAASPQPRRGNDKKK